MRLRMLDRRGKTKQFEAFSAQEFITGSQLHKLYRRMRS